MVRVAFAGDSSTTDIQAMLERQLHSLGIDVGHEIMDIVLSKNKHEVLILTRQVRKSGPTLPTQY